MARKVKKTIISGELRTTEFEDGTKLHEQLFDAVLTDGNILNTIRNSEGIKSYEMNVIAELPNGNKTNEFKALIYASLKDSAKFETDPFVADARIKLAVSKAKIKGGTIKTFSRIELPSEIIADDVFTEEMLSQALEVMKAKEVTEEYEIFELSKAELENKPVSNVEWKGLLRTTTFEDNSEIIEKVFDAKLVDGKIISTFEYANGIKSYGMIVQLMIDNKPIAKPIIASVYADELDNKKLNEENPYTEDADIKVAISRFIDDNGNIKKHAKIEPPRLVTADDIVSDDMLKDLFAIDEKESANEEDSPSNEGKSIQEKVMLEIEEDFRKSYFDLSGGDENYEIDDDKKDEAKNKRTFVKNLLICIFSFVFCAYVLNFLREDLGGVGEAIILLATLGLAMLLTNSYNNQ